MDERSQITSVQRGALRFSVAALALVLAEPALAHSAQSSSGLLSGAAHPISGFDHVLAMVAVGLWGAFLGRPAIFLLPVVFPMVMALGGALGIVGVPLAGVEALIAVSSIVLGTCIALAVRLPVPVAAAIVGVFAIFHGYAHGAELPQSADPIAYAVGFVLATGALHLSGIALGVLTRWPLGRLAIRSAGLAIAIAGAIFLYRAL